MNKILLIGRLTADPEIMQTTSGIQIGKFSLAVDRRFKNASGERETDFVSCVVWRQLADLAGQYLSKGSQVAVEGSLQSEKYEKNGEKRTAWKVQVSELQFLDKRDPGKTQPATDNAGDSDLPF